MAKLENYKGSVELIAGITQKGGGDFALVEANAVQTREDGTRLDAELQLLQAALADSNSALGEAIKSYILNLLVTGSVISYTKGDGTSESFNTTFVGTRAEYEAAVAENKVPVGTIVVITDEPDEDDEENGENGSDPIDPTPDEPDPDVPDDPTEPDPDDPESEGDVTSSILGTGKLGYMILGQN